MSIKLFHFEVFQPRAPTNGSHMLIAILADTISFFHYAWEL